MPGSIKVSGSQRTVASPYVKVSGTWRQVAAGYIKVAGSWRVWHSADISDNFNRPNSSTLGTASNGIAQWTTLKGSWGILSSQASSTTAPATGAIATTSLIKATPNYTIDIDIPSGAGVGAAFWVTDADNWWAAITHQVATTTYSCPSGGTLSGTTCTTTSTYSATANTGSSFCGYAYDSTTYRELTCYYTWVNYGGTPCGFLCTEEGGQCIDGTCKHWEQVCGVCSSNGPISSSPTNCYTGGPNTCDCGYYAGSGLCYSDYTYYTCPSGGTLSGTTCTVSSSYSATGTTTYAYNVHIIQSVSGTIYTRASFVDDSETKSLKVTTTNNAINVKAYNLVGQSGTAGELNYTASSPTITGNLGIIKTVAVTSGAASANQTNIVDNFGAR